MQYSTTKYRKIRKSWNEKGHAHELTFSCFHRLPLLNQDKTRYWLIQAIDRARTKWDFNVWAYVIMPEHVHILLNPKRDDYRISDILKSIKQPVARYAIRYLRENNSHWLSKLRVTRPNRVEYKFWQEGSGYDRNIFEEKTAWLSVKYIHNNPVARGIVTNPTDWIWSSAR